MSEPLLNSSAADYDALHEAFTWNIPSRFNIAAACLAHPADQIALIVDDNGDIKRYSFGDIERASAAVAAHLADQGVGRGDRVGVVVPQSWATAVAHMACWRIGAVSIPLSGLFGTDALSYRLSDAQAGLVIAASDHVATVTQAAPEIPVISTTEIEIIATSGATIDYADTAADDPAFLIYTSGTTGNPKGALHAHRSTFGHLTGFEAVYEFAPQPADVIWTPVDWSWIAGLMDVLIPAWHHGITVLSSPQRFDPTLAIELMRRHNVTVAFLPPTALKLMRAADVDGSNLTLRAIMSGGEALGNAIHQWASDRLGGAAINEAYGQTEANLVVGNCSSRWPTRPGSMGKALPGHDVEVHNSNGERIIDEVGEIVVRASDPVLMLEYWNNPDATAAKYRGEWLLTGDLGRQDPDGYLWFESRSDDVIISAGYRIGPGEIEASLIDHAAVAMCAVIGVPDETRGEVPAAWVILRDGYEGSDELTAELQQHVRTHLAAHEVPRFVTYVTELPQTTTGKIMRRALRR